MNRRALTLLELLVAVAILVSMTTLAGALWAQTSAWGADAQRMREALLPRQAHELFRQQWGERRPYVRLDEPEGNQGERTSARRVEFVTARPVLFPQWPLVRAAYIVVADDTPGSSLLHLDYEERRVTHPDVSTLDEFDSAGAPMVDRIRLLEGCTELAWEWYAHFEPLSEEEAAAQSALGARPQSGWYPESLVETEEPDGRFASAERRARRLAGVHEGRAFAWPIVEPSR